MVESKTADTSYPSKEAVQRYQRNLRQWFSRHGRTFIWRSTTEPYVILLSEVLLQRTQATQVGDNFESILQKFPSLNTLAGSPVHIISHTLRPLGLTKRATSLSALAKELVNRFDGEVPKDPDVLVRLPGVGRYIASATACFAYGKRAAIVDTNVIRIFARYFNFKSEKRRPQDDQQIWALAQYLLPRKNAADYNRALIDLAALICKDRKPLCHDCPLEQGCWSAANNNAICGRSI
ncbi:MAG: A/G-specific adenine glycosylase [Candidatus Bathyarchaeia archaeon]|jgi:A/G-specific adenine glycosylase